MYRLRSLLLALALVMTACGGSDDAVESTPSTEAPTSSSEASTTSTAAETTTTALEMARVTTNIVGADEPLAAAIALVYEQALNPGQESFIRLPAGLAEQFSSRASQFGEVTLQGSVATGRILETDVAVFTSGTDVVLLAGEPGVAEGASVTWQVVGAKLTSLDEPAWYGDGPRLVLVLGSDARPGQRVEGFRADSVHIVGTVAASGQGSIVGIPRDSWVETSYGGSSKLTNTMASRGPAVVLDTVKGLTQLDLEGYLLTGFAGFEDLVDAFGGFTIDVPYGMSDPKSDAYFSSGVQDFDGADALAFARNRTDTPNGDFGRSLNHGLLMLAAMPEVQAMGIDELPGLLEILMTYVTTDLSAGDLLAIAASSYELDPEQVTNLVVPGRVGSTSGGASVVFLGDGATAVFEDVADGVLDGDY
jgi:LCP family protein required for cell wall assembly